jgi:hypothetical protein
MGAVAILLAKKPFQLEQTQFQFAQTPINILNNMKMRRRSVFPICADTIPIGKIVFPIGKIILPICAETKPIGADIKPMAETQIPLARKQKPLAKI